MAQSVGFTCDFCHSFQAGVKTSNGTVVPPNGWLSVKVRTERDKDNTLDICSNLCLAKLGAERHETETGESFGKLARAEYQREWNRTRRKRKGTGDGSVQ